MTRHIDLVEQAELNSYKCDLITVEVGSRVVVDFERVNHLKKLLRVGRRELDTILVELAETAMKD